MSRPSSAFRNWTEWKSLRKMWRIIIVLRVRSSGNRYFLISNRPSNHFLRRLKMDWLMRFYLLGRISKLLSKIKDRRYTTICLISYLTSTHKKYIKEQTKKWMNKRTTHSKLWYSTTAMGKVKSAQITMLSKKYNQISN